MKKNLRSGAPSLVGVANTRCANRLVKISPDGSSKIYPFAPTGKQLGNFLMDEAGIVWVGSNAALLRFDPSTETWRSFDFRTVLPGEHEVFVLAKTAGNLLWLGTSQGLVRAKLNVGEVLNPADVEFSLLKNEPGNPNSLRNNAVAALLADPTDPAILWVGTKGGGLTRLDTRSEKMRHLTTRNGLPNDVIYNILSTPNRPTPDNLRLWLSSNKGIIRYSPATGDLQNFTADDGAQGDEFNTWAAAKTASGKLLFGGLNGLNELDPAAFSENPHLPPVFLTGLTINNQPVSVGDSTGALPQSLPFLPRIELPFSKNSLTLSFAALEFTAPGKNRFRYFLEGAEDEWAHETTDNSATYLNLAPGSYTFKIMAANGDGVWNPKPTELKIGILPPWWRSWWAYLVYVLAIAAAARWLHRFQLNRRLEHAENERLKELDTFKSRLYANITHEFRTPLTVILGMAEKLISEGVTSSHPLTLIQRNGENLLRLVNQMLDLSKLESGAMALHPERGEVVGFMKYILQSFQSLAGAKNLRLHFQPDVEECEMDFDAEKLQQILSNLLSNAIKFTPEGGDVYLQLSLIPVSTSSADRSLSIKVQDTGIGIPPDQLPHIFSRFYQADNTHTRTGEGTGIGLALVKELVKLMGGEIGVKSEVGVGTEFVVRLPIHLETQRGAVVLERFFEKNSFQNNRSPEASSAEPAPQNQAGDQPLLLLIEDNADVAHYIASCFDGEYRIVFARNGQQGIEQALDLIPDLVISDVMMPEKDGFEVVQTLKNDERTSHIPIILLTAKADVASKIEGLERGADDYLAKPFSKKELQVRLRNLLALRRRLLERYAGREVFSKIVQPPSDAAVFQLEDAFLLKIRAEVERHLQDADFGVPELSRAIGMSQSQLYRKIKALTDQSSAAFIRLVRLQKGRELLKTTRLTVSEIAYETGFSSPGYFSDAYLEAFGERPREARG